MATENSENKKEPKEIPIWEWIIAAIGLLLVVGAIGTAVYRGSMAETPPRLEITVEKVVPDANGFLVQFNLRNFGTQTAAGVVVEAQLKKNGETAETATTTLTYAPANSIRYGGVYFKNNPNEFELSVRPLGFERP